MKIHPRIFIIIIIGLLTLLTGCLRTRSDVKEVEESKMLQSQVVSMQKANADYVSRVEETLENYRSLSGRIEVLENKLAKTEGADSEKQSGNTKMVGEITEKIKLLQESVSKLEEENQALHNELLALKSRSGRGDNTNVGTESHAGIFSAAEELFKQKKWKEAILQYDEYKKKNPKGKAIPEAIYKTGVCFQELGMKDEAKVFYQEILAKFPKTEFANKAQIRLKSI
jgi:TolA-binding protein